MDDAYATITPPSRRSKVYLLRDRPAPTAQAFLHELSGDDDPIPFPPAISKSPLSPSPHPIVNSSKQVAAQERLLLLSQSPKSRRKSLFLVQDESLEPGAKLRRRSKNRPASGVTSSAELVVAGCGSPKNARRARRRHEKEIILRDDVADRESVRVRRQRQPKNGNPRDEKPGLVLPEPRQGCTENALDGIKEAILELIMWKNFAKSSLWFGLGTLCFTSSCFSGDVSFSSVSAVSNLGLLLLAMAFIRDSVPRGEEKAKGNFRIKEEDVLKVIRLILPAVNAAIVAIQRIFSGEPSTTLMVAPVLLFTARYGHCITLWRLLAAGFFIGFTVPKLYSIYSSQIQRHAASVGKCILEGWEACRRRKFLGVSAAMTLWNLLSVRTRVIAAFTCLVVLRYYRQRCNGNLAGTIVPEKQEVGNLREQNAGDGAI